MCFQQPWKFDWWLRDIYSYFWTSPVIYKTLNIWEKQTWRTKYALSKDLAMSIVERERTAAFTGSPMIYSKWLYYYIDVTIYYIPTIIQMAKNSWLHISCGNNVTAFFSIRQTSDYDYNGYYVCDIKSFEFNK